MLIDFTGVFCPNCRKMEESVMPRPEVVDRLKQFVTVQLYTDQVPISTLTIDQQKELAIPHQDMLARFLREISNPLYVILTSDEQILGQKAGYVDPSTFVAFLDSGLEKSKSTQTKAASSTAAN